jgi:hypothetical protein
LFKRLLIQRLIELSLPLKVTLSFIDKLSLEVSKKDLGEAIQPI